MTRVPDATLALPIEGLNLTGATLAEEMDASSGPFTMLAFIRHYGCMFGREMIRDIRHASETIPGYPSPLFFGMGDRVETTTYMADLWPEARMICDPERELFTAFNLGHGSVMQIFGPAVWACTLRATFKGNFLGKFVGDPWIMPGLFVIDRSNAIRFSHEFRHQGDHPDWAKIPTLVGRPAAAMPLAAAVLV